MRVPPRSGVPPDAGRLTSRAPELGPKPGSIPDGELGRAVPWPGLATFVHRVQRAAVMGAMFLSVGLASPGVQAAVLGASPKVMTGASISTVAEIQAADFVFAFVKQSPADQRFSELAAHLVLSGQSPEAALGKAFAQAKLQTGATPSHRAFREAEVLLSLAPKARTQAATQLLTQAAKEQGVALDALRETLKAEAPPKPGGSWVEPGALADQVYDLLDQGEISAEALRAFQQAAMDNPPDAATMQGIRAKLFVNNGTVFSAAQRTKVLAFVEHPSPELRKMAFDLAQPQLSPSGVRALIKAARAGGGSEAALRGALLATAEAFDFAPGAQALLRREIDKHDVQEVLQEALSGPLDQPRWDREVAPNLDGLPHAWSEAADLVLAARLNPNREISPAVRQQMDTFLESRGYPMGLPLGSSVQAVRARNVTAPDVYFEGLMNRAGRDGVMTIGIADGGFDVTHGGLLGQRQANADEIPNNHIDDDKDGYVDNYDGLNLTGIVRGGRDWDGKKQGDLRTGHGVSDHHGNHVTGVATRGTERIKGALCATTSGSLPQAFEYLIAEGATVINFSMGSDPRALDETVAVIDKYPHVLFVQAAGNDGLDLSVQGTVFTTLTEHPRPNLVHVAAADEHGQRLESSNYSSQRVHLAAAAKHYSFTLTDGQSNQRFGAGLYYYGGQTSQASPNSANVLAKVRLLAPQLSPAEAVQVVTLASDARPDWANEVKSGGLVNKDRALSLGAAFGLVKDGLSIDAAVAQLQLEPGVAAFVQASLHTLIGG